MTSLKRETAKMLLETSTKLAQVAASASFELWEREDFRLHLRFEKINKTEQDRIFNELEVSVLGLFDLHFDYITEIANPESEKVLRILKKGIRTEFLGLFSELDVEKQHIDMWDHLISLRFKEYREHYKLLLSESLNWTELKGGRQERVVFARIQTITLDCLTHLRRGNLTKDDPLLKILRKWFILLDGHIMPIENLVTVA